MKTNAYRICGISVFSELLLPGAIPAKESTMGESPVTIERGTLPEELPIVTSSGERWQANATQFLLDVPLIARFLIEDGQKITFSPAPEVSEHDLCVFILGTAFGVLLHQRKAMVLHGSAVAHQGQAILLCGRSGAGKSTLAAALCDRGYSFVADDLCVVTQKKSAPPQVLPDGRQFKLWGQSIDHLNWSSRRGKVVRESFDKYFLPAPTVVNSAVTIAAIYILSEERPGNERGIHPLTLPDAARALEMESYRPYFRRLFNTPAAVMEQSAQILAYAPAFLFTRPLGFELMEAGIEQLCAHWQSLSPSQATVAV